MPCFILKSLPARDEALGLTNFQRHGLDSSASQIYETGYTSAFYEAGGSDAVLDCSLRTIRGSGSLAQVLMCGCS